MRVFPPECSFVLKADESVLRQVRDVGMSHCSSVSVC